MRRKGLGAMVMGLALMFALCSGRAGNPETVVVAMDSMPQSLDPRIGTDLSSQKIHQLLFNSLVKKDRQGNMVKDLIDEFRFPDPLTLEIRLRRGVRFHDGRTLTARDVKYTYDSLMDSSFRSLRKSAFRSLDFIEILDAGRLRFHLKRVDGSFINNLIIGILPADLQGNPDRDHSPVGTGPFRLLEWTGNIIRLQAFRENRENQNNFSFLTLKVISDAVTRGLELQKGSVDIAINNIPFDSVPVLKAEPHLKIARSRGSKYTYLAFNLKNEALARRDIRLAIALAIDRDKIIRHLFHGYAVKAETLLSMQNEYFQPLEYRPYRPALSRDLLARHGYTGDHPLKLEMKLSNSGMGRQLGLIFARELAEVNIRLDLAVREFSAFYNDIKNGNFQMYALSWVGISDPDIFYYIFHSEMTPPDGANRGFFSSTRLDRWTEQAQNSYDRDTRRAFYARIQELVYRELPYVSLWYEDNLAVCHRRIRDLVPYAFGDFYPLAQIRVVKP